MNARTVYVFIEFSASIFFAMMFTVTSLYEATVAGLTPVQLILVGTTLEISAFVFEVPTGIVADVYSRRLSIVIGYILMGLGFLVEGFFPILHRRSCWRRSYGVWATPSPLAQRRHGSRMRSASRMPTNCSCAPRRSVCSLRSSGWDSQLLLVRTVSSLPLQVGGIGVMLIGVTLAVIMPETGFHPTPHEDRTTWGHMWHTFKQGVDVVRSKPRLMSVVGVGLFYGIYSEGFDRLWVKHLLDTFELPVIFGGNQVAFFAVLRDRCDGPHHSRCPLCGETRGLRAVRSRSDARCCS
ncbi:MAG: hypothetical protein MZV63_45775 [Marinilabiliales bacterium]|nr:hypothetical protein [Marinilabiliales bacterium]